VSNRIWRWFQEEPLAAGAVAALLGGVTALLLPATEMERRLLGGMELPVDAREVVEAVAQG